MICGRISSDKEELNKLHKKYWWIPDETMIRPTPKMLEDKLQFSNYILHNWMSFKDFILHTHFKYPVDSEDGHLYVKKLVEKLEWVFIHSMFSYKLPNGVHHYVLWNSMYDFFMDFDDSKINLIIKETLEEMLNTDAFDFAWYKNPKPSIPELYHIQVFWIKL